jgi:4-amino-4-deoxy-L-arabinose transferase-like glycosyltransferase
MNEEPTVLDYVKSKIFFWRGERIEIPLGEPANPALSGAAGPGVAAQPEGATAEPALNESAVPKRDTPLAVSPSPAPISLDATQIWAAARLLAPLFLALLAQRALEPPGRAIGLGAFFYFWAVAVLALSLWRGDWKYDWKHGEMEAGKATGQDATFRPAALAVAAILELLAFLAFGDNRFTSLNLAIWLLSLGAYLRAFWLPDPHQPGIFGRAHIVLGEFRENGLRFSPWTLLVLAVFALAAFYRFYQLDLVPKEMFSDHAEKLLDVADVLHGQYSIFFPRNTGREAFQMYLTAAMALIFGTGLSFISLKLGTALAGVLTLPFIYLTGKEIANRRVGLLAMLLAGIAYWPNVISRVALRFTLYPFFYAPMLYFLVRAFRRRSRNDFILAGIFLGLGMHGYSPFRFVPFVVLAAFGLYLLHRQSAGARKLVWGWLAVLVGASLIVFLPLARYWLSEPGMFSYRAMSRMTGMENPLPAPAWQIFLSNTWRALIMPFWDNGEIWVHSVTHRPALDVVSAGLFFLGVVLLIGRYLRRRDWLDIFLLISIPLLMMPSILSLAFPGENPSLNRTGAAMVPVFLIAALALEGLATRLKSHLPPAWGGKIAWGLAILLVTVSINQNYDLVFRQYKTQFDLSSWNTSELGAVIRQFADSAGTEDSAWVIPYPHWVDTRLVGIRAGVPLKDYALWADHLEETLPVPGPKLFLFKPEDTNAAARLREVYPQGLLSLHTSALPGKDFYIYFVPDSAP